MYCSGALVSVYLSVEILVSMQCSLLLPFSVFPLDPLGQQQGEDEPMPSAQLTSRDLRAVEPRPCFSFPLPGVCTQEPSSLPSSLS